ncbi:hypothetical protein [Salipiger abyssi]|uniref:hypothetical protein n=1 Tax=Salipiger abyssi TaxID=1250539 RepID=UPI001A8D637D|nr:hypothetical protein [Salipiger abyssi]MBN9886388.1 hypothetical protein [Salipiger abyssi]
MSDPRPGLYLHLGLHRTGTGAFQDFLAANLATLGAAGVRAKFSNRDGTGPETLRLKLPPPRDFGTEAMAAHGRKLARTVRRNGLNAPQPVLISEENLIGALNAAFGVAPYSHAQPRLALLRQQLTQPVRRVVLVLRSYESHAISVYRKRLEFRLLKPFEHYAAAMWPARRGWPELVADIRAALDPEEIVILRHEARPARPEILSALLPELPHGGWDVPERRINHSANDAACFALVEAHKAGRSPDRAELATLLAAHADKTAPRPFIDLPEALLAAQRARYAEDLDRIARMPGVTLYATAAQGR